MEAYEDTIVARPALKRLEGLLDGGARSAPGDVYRALQRDDLSGALEAARRRWSKGGASDRIGAITYATLLVVRGLSDEARGVIERSRDEHPGLAALAVLEAEHLMLTGADDEAREALLAIDLEALDAWGVASVIGDLLLDLGDEKQAMDAYRRAIEMGSRDIETAIRVAQLSMDAGELRQAAETFQRAAEGAKDRVGLWEATADAWFRVGEDERGLMAYEHVLELEPSEPRDWLEHGLALARLGRADAAESALERCVDLDPFDVDAWVTLGQVRMQLGRAEEALPAFERALEHSEDDVDALLGVVSAALVIGDLRQAEEVARRAVEVLPEDPEAHHSLGVTLQERGRHADAIESLARAVELADELDLPDSAYRVSLALSYLANGQLEQALESAGEVLDSEGVDAGLVAEFVEGLIRAGAFDEAIEVMDSVDATSGPNAVLFPVFEYVMAAYRGDDADALADAVVEAVRAHDTQIPVDWDFAQLERLSLRMDRDEQSRFDRLVDMVEGREAP